MNFDIKSGSVQRYSPCYIVFDLLYLNGEVMTNKPLRERLEKLQTIIDDQEGLIAASSHTFAKYKLVQACPSHHPRKLCLAVCRVPL